MTSYGDLARHIRLGEDSALELKQVAVAGSRVTAPRRNDVADELGAFAVAGSVTGSLRLLRVDRLRLIVSRPGEAFGNNKRRVQGWFRYAKRDYALWVTDPRWERTYLAKLNGTYDVGGCYLTISLGEPYGDACYKLIAAIIPAA